SAATQCKRRVMSRRPGERSTTHVPGPAERAMTDFYNLVPTAPQGRFDGIERPYSPEEVERLRGSIPIRYTLAEHGANRLWQLIHEESFVNALGAVTGNQAMQQVRAGLKAIYLSGWQVAADANT